MNKSFIEYIVNNTNLKTNHYRIILLLNTGTYPQYKVAELLGLKKQNIYKYFKDLTELGLIELDRIEGKNKFYRLITDVNKINELPLKGQLNLIQEVKKNEKRRCS